MMPGDAHAGARETRPIFLAIEGVIGVGKTTLARLLQPRFQSELVLEAFDRNPFLSDFYGDRARYAFQTQMFFLLSRYRQGQMVPELLGHAPVIADYMFAKDSLFAHLNLVGDELDMYERLYDALATQMAVPDLVIYLRANTDVLMARIAIRDRAYERHMDRAYIEDLRQAYDRTFSRYTETPLLVINANELDFVRDPAALNFIEAQVRTKLRHGQYQQVLPQMESAQAQLVPAGAATWRQQGEIPAPEVIGAYLRASEAMGRLGALLADAADSEYASMPGPELSEAVGEISDRLRRLSQMIGVNLPQEVRDVA